MTEGFVHKHLKVPFGARERRPLLDAARARLRTTMTPRIAGLGVSAGGVGASLTAIATHQASTAAIAAIGATVVVSFIAKCVECFFQHRQGIIQAQGKAVVDQIEAKARAQSRQVRDETQRALLLKAADEPAKAARIERMLALLNLTALADTCELTGKDAYAIGTLLAQYRPEQMPDENPPGDEGGEFPRAV
jgi:hypothetical protein